jgi:hypothetical protein
MAQWYLSYGKEQSGPYDDTQIRFQIDIKGKNGFAWQEGFSNWLPISDIPELLQTSTLNNSAPTPPPNSAPGNVSQINTPVSKTDYLAPANSDEIDYKIFGAEMQFVEKTSWIPSLGIEYYMGVDGISISMILLTLIIGVMATLASWRISIHQRGYFSMFLLLETAMLGVFVALDMILFYLFCNS